MGLVQILVITSLFGASMSIIPPSFEVEPGGAPYFAYFRFTNNFCGGTLITENIVLTAGHCVPRTKIEIMDTAVDLGAPNMDGYQDYIQQRNVKATTRHQKYKLDKNGIQAFHDIGLMLLDKPINVTDYVKPISIAMVNPTAPATVYGYGSINLTHADNSPKLLMREMKIIDDIQCQMMLENTTYKVEKTCDNICSTLGPCWGDSGGPLVQMHGEQSVLVGLVSWAVDDIDGCDKVPTMSVKVGEYYEWINEEIGKLAKGEHVEVDPLEVEKW